MELVSKDVGVLKITVLVLVAVWLLSAIFGGHKRLIRDVNHLLQLIIWAAIAFAGIHALQAFSTIMANPIIYGVSTLGVFGIAWALSRFVVKKLGRQPVSSPRSRKRRS